MLTLARIAAIAVTAAALSACSPALLDPRQKGECLQGYVDDKLLQSELAQQPTCCASLEALPFDTFNKYERNPAEKNQMASPAGTSRGFEPVDMWIARTDPVFDFPTGKSRFAAFDLQTLPRRPNAIVIYPQPFGLYTVANGCSDVKASSARRYFRPIITVLDDQKKPLQSAMPGEPIEPVVSGGLRFHLPTGSRYLIIHTGTQHLGKHFYLPGGQMTTTLPVGGAFITQESDGTVDGIAASTGWLRMVFGA